MRFLLIPKPHRCLNTITKRKSRNLAYTATLSVMSTINRALISMYNFLFRCNITELIKILLINWLNYFSLSRLFLRRHNFCLLQACLFLRQNYIPKNVGQIWHKIPISWRFWNWKPHSIQCMTKRLAEIRSCRVYSYSIYSIYTFFRLYIYFYTKCLFIYLFIMQ